MSHQVKPHNLIFIMSDQHNRDVMGCSGHRIVQTPHLDKLAQGGVRFTNAYCNSPICVPSRASFATGRYVHDIGCWDNAAPYTGNPASWAHRLTEQGYKVISIGKLHYRSDEDDTGFSEKRLSMHVAHGIGDLYTSLIRENIPAHKGPRNSILNAGAGESNYIQYDLNIAEEAVTFLKEEAPHMEQPWVLFISFISPHPPLKVPQPFLDMYPPDQLDLPLHYAMEERADHPVLNEMRRARMHDDELEPADIRKALATYYGLCSFLDSQVGKVMEAVEEEGWSNNTRVIYTSDHGDNLGNHGLWFKCTMYEGSAGVPLIMSGPDIPVGEVNHELVTLVDCFPTILDSVGAQLMDEDKDLPGSSLYTILNNKHVPGRIAFSEFHAAYSITAMFMLRMGDYKYVCYPGYPPQLFDIQQDPSEYVNLAQHADYSEVLTKFELALTDIVQPEEVNTAAKADQNRRLELFGGRDRIMQGGPMDTYDKFSLQA